MDNIIVEDTNIFIDLLSIDLLEICFRLPVRIHTTEFSISELSEDQQSIVLDFVKQDRLYLKEFSAHEVSLITEHQIVQTNNVSFTDCSVWLYAKWNGYRLVTGDKKLRRSAEQDGVVVSGILYLFDLLVKHGLLTPPAAAEKLSALYVQNRRLPKTEVENRINEWSKR